MARPISVMLLLVSIMILIVVLRTERTMVPHPASDHSRPGRVASKEASSQAKGIERQSKHPSKPPAQTPSPSEKEQGLSSLEGSVTSAEDGSPIPDAVVNARSGTAGIQRAATTSPEGRYLFSGLPPGVYIVSCEREGYEGEEEEPLSVIVGKRAQCDFRLTQFLVVRGSVKDRGGKPIAGAEIEIQSSPPVWQYSVETDEEGCYEISTVGTYHSFTVSKLGYVVERRWIEGKPKQADFVLNRRRRRQVEVFGTVKDSEGKPLPDIRVYLSVTWVQGNFGNTVGMEDYLSMSDGSPELSIVAKSDPTGNYRIQTTFCGDADRLFLLAEDYRQEALLTDGENRIGRDIVLPRKLGGTTTVRGKVIDGVTKLPLEGVIIDPNGIISGPHGEFTLATEGSKSNVRIGFEKKGYSYYEGVPFLHDPDHPREIDLGEVPLYPPAKVLCSVHDETGLSVQPGFAIICAGRALMISGLIFDNDNIASFEVDHIPAEGVRATMIISSMYHEPHEETVSLHAGAITRLEIVMKSRHLNSYTIIVANNRGDPLEGAVVKSSADASFTDLSGRASISAYGGESCSISARGYGEETVELSDTVNVVSVVLSPTLSISGRVVAEDGTVVAGALIYCTKAPEKDSNDSVIISGTFTLSGGHGADGVTDAQGHFEIKGLRSDKTYNLYASHPHHQLQSETMTGVAPGATDITLIAKRNLPGELVVHFIGEEPPEGEGCTIWIFDGDSAVQIPQSRLPQSRLDFVKNRRIKGEGVRPGLYTIELFGDHFCFKTITDVRISPGGSTVLDVEVERGITLAGRLVDREGKAVSGVSVYAAGGRDVTSLDGSFRIEHVSPSTIKLYIEGDEPREIDISGRDLAKLILTLE